MTNYYFGVNLAGYPAQTDTPTTNPFGYSPANVTYSTSAPSTDFIFEIVGTNVASIYTQDVADALDVIKQFITGHGLEYGGTFGAQWPPFQA